MSKIDEFIKTYTTSTAPDIRPVTRGDLVYMATCIKEDMEALRNLLQLKGAAIYTDTVPLTPVTPIQPAYIGDDLNAPKTISQSNGNESQ